MTVEASSPIASKLKMRYAPETFDGDFPISKKIIDSRLNWLDDEQKYTLFGTATTVKTQWQKPND